VTPGYFAAPALPIRRGRDFTDADGARTPRIAIVNETLAERAFGGSNPIGRRVAFSPTGPFDIEIVGVVRDLRYEHLREAAPDGIFFPLAQIPKEETESKTATGGDEPLDLTAMVRMREGQPMTRSLDRFEDSLSEPRYVVASSGDSRASLCAHSNPPPPSVGACLAALTPFGAASAPFILRLHARSEVSGCPIDLTGRRERAAG